VSQEIQALIFRIAAENPTWGAPRIHGELLKLGFQLSEATVSRWLRLQLMNSSLPCKSTATTWKVWPPTFS
jgi:putative transposase